MLIIRFTSIYQEEHPMGMPTLNVPTSCLQITEEWFHLHMYFSSYSPYFLTTEKYGNIVQVPVFKYCRNWICKILFLILKFLLCSLKVPVPNRYTKFQFPNQIFDCIFIVFLKVYYEECCKKWTSNKFG